MGRTIKLALKVGRELKKVGKHCFKQNQKLRTGAIPNALQFTSPMSQSPTFKACCVSHQSKVCSKSWHSCIVTGRFHVLWKFLIAAQLSFVDNWCFALVKVSFTVRNDLQQGFPNFFKEGQTWSCESVRGHECRKMGTRPPWVSKIHIFLQLFSTKMLFS